MSIFYTKFPFWATFSDSVDILLKQGWLSNTKFHSYKWHMSGCNWCVHLASILTDFKPGGLKLIKGYFCCCALLFVLWRQYKPSISYLIISWAQEKMRFKILWCQSDFHDPLSSVSYSEGSRKPPCIYINIFQFFSSQMFSLITWKYISFQNRAHKQNCIPSLHSLKLGARAAFLND